MKEKGEVIPTPTEAVALLKKMKTAESLTRMKLENIMLKHLINLLDPEHDYIFNQDTGQLLKVKHGTKIQSSTSKEGERQSESSVGGEARGFNVSDRRAFAGEASETEDPS